MVPLYAIFRTHFAGRVAAVMAATIFSTLISISILPLATRTVNAADYGTYALLMSIVALVGAAMDGGASILMPSAYGTASMKERGRLFATVAGLAAAGAVLFALVLLCVGYSYHGTQAWQDIPLDAIALSALMMPMRAVCGVAVIAFSTTSSSGAIAIQMIAQALFVFAGTLVALYAFGVGSMSLFVGAFCGQLAALIAALQALVRQGELPAAPSRYWLRRAFHNAKTSGASGAMDGSRGFVGNALLASAYGLHSVGIFNHARLYYTLFMALMSSVTHGIQARSLEEARELRSAMDDTRIAWTSVHMVLAAAGVFFALFGWQVVDLISNGKLLDAAPYIPVLIATALIQVTQQPAAAILYALDRARLAVHFRIFLSLGALIALVPAIKLFGISGIIGIGVIEAGLYRLFLGRLAGKLRRVPFQDDVACFGIALIAGTMLWEMAAMPLFYGKLTWFALSIAAIAFAGRRSFIDILSKTRALRGDDRLFGPKFEAQLRTVSATPSSGER